MYTRGSSGSGEERTAMAASSVAAVAAASREQMERTERDGMRDKGGERLLYRIMYRYDIHGSI